MSNIGFVYEWTNNVNGMKYIGSHVGSEDDGYIGSGTAFRKDLKHYGLQSFTRKILEYADDEKVLAELEREWLTKVNARDNQMYYNRTNGSSVVKKKKRIQRSRGLCKTCNNKPVAINYTDTLGITHYRTQCDTCLRQGKKIKPVSPGWARAGYKKKPQCEKCGFVAKMFSQLNVFHVDGNLKNNDWVNLKTICLNCTEEIYKSKLKWNPSPPVQDF